MLKETRLWPRISVKHERWLLMCNHKTAALRAVSPVVGPNTLFFDLTADEAESGVRCLHCRSRGAAIVKDSWGCFDDRMIASHSVKYLPPSVREALPPVSGPWGGEAFRAAKPGRATSRSSRYGRVAEVRASRKEHPFYYLPSRSPFPAGAQTAACFMFCARTPRKIHSLAVTTSLSLSPLSVSGWV